MILALRSLFSDSSVSIFAINPVLSNTCASSSSLPTVGKSTRVVHSHYVSCSPTGTKRGVAPSHFLMLSMACLVL